MPFGRISRTEMMKLFRTKSVRRACGSSCRNLYSQIALNRQELLQRNQRIHRCFKNFSVWTLIWKITCLSRNRYHKQDLISRMLTLGRLDWPNSIIKIPVRNSRYRIAQSSLLRPETRSVRLSCAISCPVPSYPEVTRHYSFLERTTREMCLLVLLEVEVFGEFCFRSDHSTFSIVPVVAIVVITSDRTTK